MLSRIKKLLFGGGRKSRSRRTVARRRRLFLEQLGDRVVLSATLFASVLGSAVAEVGAAAQPQEVAAPVSMDALQWQIVVGVNVAEGEAGAPPYATGVFYPDTDGNGSVAPLDVLKGINRLNTVGSRVVDIFADAPNWYDASGDGYHSPLDELLKINWLNQHGSGPFPKPPLTNFAPRGQDMVIPMPEQSSMAFSAPFLDPEQLPMDFWVIDGPQHGTITQAVPNGNVFVYRPEYGFFDGTDYVIIEAMDSGAMTATARVEFTVSFDPSLPHPPVAVVDVLETWDDITGWIDPTLNDRSFSGALQVVDNTQAQNGQVNRIWNGLFYTPNHGFVGQDAFEYTIEDGAGLRAEGRVEVTVMFNNPPVPSSPTFQMVEDNAFAFVARDLGTDPDGHALDFVVLSSPQHGGFSTSQDPWSYVPNPDFIGEDSFTYLLVDDFGKTAAGVVTINVLPDLFEGPYLTRSEVVYSLVEAYAGGVIIDHTGVQSYSDVPSTYWAWAHWEELSSEGWDDSGFAVGTEAYPERPVTYGEIVLLGEILTGRPYANGMHLATAVDLCWVTQDEANRPADSVATQRGIALMAVMHEETACGLSPTDVDLLVQDFLQQIHQ